MSGRGGSAVARTAERIRDETGAYLPDQFANPRAHYETTALRVARELGPGHRVACVAPDSGARYLSTELYGGEGDDEE